MASVYKGKSLVCCNKVKILIKNWFLSFTTSHSVAKWLNKSHLATICHTSHMIHHKSHLCHLDQTVTLVIYFVSHVSHHTVSQLSHLRSLVIFCVTSLSYRSHIVTLITCCHTNHLSHNFVTQVSKWVTSFHFSHTRNVKIQMRHFGWFSKHFDAKREGFFSKIEKTALVILRYPSSLQFWKVYEQIFFSL